MHVTIFDTVTPLCVSDVANAQGEENKYVWRLFVYMLRQQRTRNLPGMYIGLAYGEADEDHKQSRVLGGILFVVVDKMARIDLLCSTKTGVGAGKCLLKKTEEFVSDILGLDKIVAHPTETSIPFFERHGFILKERVMERYVCSVL